MHICHHLNYEQIQHFNYIVLYVTTSFQVDNEVSSDESSSKFTEVCEDMRSLNKGRRKNKKRRAKKRLCKKVETPKERMIWALQDARKIRREQVKTLMEPVRRQ